MVATIEPPLAFLEEQKKAVLGDAVEPSQVALGLVPEILDPVDVVLPVREALRMVDPDMVEVRDIQGVIASETVRVDDAVGQNHTFHDGQQRRATGIGNHDRVDLSAALQQPENRDFTCCSPASFAFNSFRAEVRFVYFFFTLERKFTLTKLSDPLPEQAQISVDRIAVKANK